MPELICILSNGGRLKPKCEAGNGSPPCNVVALVSIEESIGKDTMPVPMAPEAYTCPPLWLAQDGDVGQ